MVWLCSTIISDFNINALPNRFFFLFLVSVEAALVLLTCFMCCSYGTNDRILILMIWIVDFSVAIWNWNSICVAHNFCFVRVIRSLFTVHIASSLWFVLCACEFVCVQSGHCAYAIARSEYFGCENNHYLRPPKNLRSERTVVFHPSAFQSAHAHMSRRNKYRDIRPNAWQTNSLELLLFYCRLITYNGCMECTFE